jgi:hypothetical protein
MNIQAPLFAQVVTTTETVYSWVNPPVALATMFALAGTVFIGIYMLRRVRGHKDANGNLK